MQTILPNSWMGLVSCVATVMLMSACTTLESTRVPLDQSVHFVTPAGTDVVVKPGTYRVEPAGDLELQLLSEQGAAVVLRAESVSELSSPPEASDHTAMIMAFEPDAYDVVLQRPGRPALVAHGSVSGIQSRAPLTSLRAGLTQNMSKGPADLMGCVAHYVESTCSPCPYHYSGCDCPIQATLYYVKITNLGSSTAPPSKARFKNASASSLPYTFGVGSLAPGQIWPEYKTWGSKGYTEQQMGPRPWIVSVDVENVVAESNESNNTAGECP